MPITPYLDDFDVDPETKRAPTESSPDESSNLPRPASAIPISCVKARLRNYAGNCTETNKQNAGLASKSNASTAERPLLHAPTALASKGPGAASLLMVDCETP